MWIVSLEGKLVPRCYFLWKQHQRLLRQVLTREFSFVKLNWTSVIRFHISFFCLQWINFLWKVWRTDFRFNVRRSYIQYEYSAMYRFWSLFESPILTFEAHLGYISGLRYHSLCQIISRWIICHRDRQIRQPNYARTQWSKVDLDLSIVYANLTKA